MQMRRNNKLSLKTKPKSSNYHVLVIMQVLSMSRSTCKRTIAHANSPHRDSKAHSGATSIRDL